MPEDELKRQIDFYARRAQRFDRSITSLGPRENRNHLRKIGAIAEALGVSDRTSQRPRTILEVGTGTGLHAKWLLDHTEVSYWGIDASPQMLGIARERLSTWSDRLRLLIGDAQRLPFPDASFDAAFCSGTLHHLTEPSKGVHEIARVVRPGGRVAVMEPNWKFPTVFIASVVARVERNAFKISPRRLEAWAADSGLERIELRHLLYTPPRPRRLEMFFDRVDAVASSVVGVRGLSIMLLLSGRKA